MQEITRESGVNMSKRERSLCKTYEWHSQALRVREIEDDVCPTIASTMGMGGANMTTPALITQAFRKQGHPMHKDMVQKWEETEVSDTLNIFDNSETRTPTLIVEEEEMEELKTVVRRLTPTECERLQGYPDGWTDIGEWVDSKGKKHKEADSPRYKALGNSIALPFWSWMIGRIAKILKEDGVEHPTMASLFDGIGGFPLVSQRHGIEPIWASEIEEFPIAVTKKHFPEEKTNDD